MRQSRLIHNWRFNGLDEGEASNLRVQRLSPEGVGVWMFDNFLIGFREDASNTFHLYQGYRSIRPRSDTTNNRILQLVEVVADEIHEDAKPGWDEEYHDGLNERRIYFDPDGRDELPAHPKVEKPLSLWGTEEDTLA